MQKKFIAVICMKVLPCCCHKFFPRKLPVPTSTTRGSNCDFSNAAFQGTDPIRFKAYPLGIAPMPLLRTGIDDKRSDCTCSALKTLFSCTVDGSPGKLRLGDMQLLSQDFIVLLSPETKILEVLDPLGFWMGIRWFVLSLAPHCLCFEGIVIQSTESNESGEGRHIYPNTPAMFHSVPNVGWLGLQFLFLFRLSEQCWDPKSQQSY